MSKIKINKLKTMMVIYKKCNKCGKVLFYKEFNKDKSKKYGIKNICKQCTNSKYTKTCVLCGKDFKTCKNSQIYCSMECLSKSQVKRIKTICDYCNKEYYIQECYLKERKNHYCSKECKYKAHSIKMKNNYNPRYNSKNIKCDYCGKEFEKRKSSIGNNNFCCAECYWEYRKLYYTKENHSSWNPYLTDEERENKRHYEAYNIWRKEVFERDGYKCRCCGKDTHKNVAHHLDGYNWSKDTPY